MLFGSHTLPGMITCVFSLPVFRGTSGQHSGWRMVMSGADRPPARPPVHRMSLSAVLKRLKLCGWYWGELSSTEAESILLTASPGAFLVRDSNDACHLFTVSAKVKDFVISVRVAFSRGYFKLDSSSMQWDCPAFSCVVDLIDYYMTDTHRCFYVDVPNIGEMIVKLRHPMLKEVPTLQHLCRTIIVRHYRTNVEVNKLPLPAHLKRYILEFCPFSDESSN